MNLMYAWNGMAVRSKRYKKHILKPSLIYIAIVVAQVTRNRGDVMTETQLTNRQSYWLDHYHRCKEQKLLFEDYCRQNNLSPGAFAHARGKLTKIGAIHQEKSDKLKETTGFVAVKPAQAPTDTQSAQIVLSY